ncbi:MAG: hypothetical protein ACP5FT_01565 [Acidilobus sp.]
MAAVGSVLLGLLAFSSASAIAHYVRGPSWASIAVGVAFAAACFPILDSAMGKFHSWLVNLVSELSGGDDEELGGEGEVNLDEDYVDGDEDSLFLVYALVNDMSRQIFKDLKSIYVEVYLPDSLFIYPEPYEDEDQSEFFQSDFVEGVQASLRDGRLIVRMDGRVYARLVNVVERGEGEVGVIEDEDELRALYEVAKAVAEAGIDEEGFASYAAYKALLKMMRQHRLSVPERLRDLLPFEDRELRRRIREQVAEEGITQEG